MGYMARWGPKSFLVSPKKIAVLEGLETSLRLKEDSENDTSGTQPTNTRGRELRPISFKVHYLAAAGVNPREQIESWEAELGNAYPLIIGEKRFGAAKMKLTEVRSSEIQLSNRGDFISAVVNITLEEYSGGKSSQLVSTSGVRSSSVGTSDAAKKEAFGATASQADRALRNVAIKAITEVQIR